MCRVSESDTKSTPSLPEDKKCEIQYRYVLIALGFLGLMLVYGMRVNLNVAMVAMVNQSAVAETTLPGDCPVVGDHGDAFKHKIVNGSFSGRPPETGATFNWDPTTQGLILGAFYYGYILTPIPGGRLAERYGAKWLFGCGTLFTGLLSLLIPVAAYAGGAWGLVVVRVLQGIGEGVTYPAIEAQVAHWFPVNERATAVALIHTGGFVGVAVGLYSTGALAAAAGGWQAAFYASGVASIVWFVLWATLASSRPDEHPLASRREVELIRTALADQLPTHAAYIPWKRILTSPAVFGVICAHFGTHWLQYILVTELPQYLGTVLNFDIKENGLYSALPYAGAIAAGAMSGPVADWLRKHRWLSGTAIRKLFNGLAHLVPSLMLISVVWLAGCDGRLSLILFVIAGTVRGVSEAGYMSIPVDMAPDYAGTIIGLCVCIGNTTGFLVPSITGALIQNENTTRMWSYNFYLAGGVGLVTGLMFQLFASADLQPWGLAERAYRLPPRAHPATVETSFHDAQPHNAAPNEAASALTATSAGSST